MASLKKISKTKRGSRNDKILARRHKKARQYDKLQVEQHKLIDELTKQVRLAASKSSSSAV